MNLTDTEVHATLSDAGSKGHSQKAPDLGA